MAYTEVEARERLLDELADATDHLGEALASLGAAYEQLDEQQADRLRGASVSSGSAALRSS